jgi:hypothetical protein
MFDRCVNPQQYRAKLEYDRAYTAAMPYERYTMDEIKTDPKLHRKWNDAWARVDAAEKKLTWWQTRAVDPA